MKSKMSAPKRLQVLSLLTRLVTEGINACAKNSIIKNGQTTSLGHADYTSRLIITVKICQLDMYFCTKVSLTHVQVLFLFIGYGMPYLLNQATVYIIILGLSTHSWAMLILQKNLRIDCIRRVGQVIQKLLVFIYTFYLNSIKLICIHL